MNIGNQFRAKKSINPLPKLPTTPNWYIVADINAPNTAWVANNIGAANKNVNSIGSVIPVKKPVSAAGINNPATTFFLLSLAVTYIAKAAAGKPNTFELPCNENPPWGNNSFNGVELWENSWMCCTQ